MRRYILLFITIIILLSSGCSQKAKVEQDLVAALDFGVTSLDPAYLRLLNEQYIACNLWEGLVRRNEDGSIEPGVAESWEVSKDSLKYIFYLRKNAKWSDGEPITAYHFEYAWKRALDPNKNSAVVSMMYFLKNGQAYNKNNAKIDDVGVNAIDDYTLEVTLENKTPYFLEILNYHTYYPTRPDIINKYPDSWDRKTYTLISNGPFYLVDWDYNKEIKTLKNPYYWDQSNVKLNSLTFLIERRDNEDVWNRYLNREIHYGYVFPEEVNIPNEIESNKHNVFLENYPSTFYLCINSKNKPFDNIKVRQALELALNKNRITQKRNYGEEVATGFVPPGIPDAHSNTDFRKKGGELMRKDFNSQNIIKAKALLKEAGYSNISDFPTVVILARDSQTVKYIEDELENNLGINVEVDACKEGLYSQKRNSRDFDIIVADWIADFLDPINFLGYLANENAFKDIFPPNYYSLVEKSNTTADNLLRMDLLHKAEKTLMDSYTLIPLFYKKDAYYLQPYVKGFFKSSLAEINFRNCYIENQQ